jgi:hypothetical protein
MACGSAVCCPTRQMEGGQLDSSGHEWRQVPRQSNTLGYEQRWLVLTASVRSRVKPKRYRPGSGYVRVVGGLLLDRGSCSLHAAVLWALFFFVQIDFSQRYRTSPAELMPPTAPHDYTPQSRLLSRLRSVSTISLSPQQDLKHWESTKTVTHALSHAPSDASYPSRSFIGISHVADMRARFLLSSPAPGRAPPA